MAVLITEKIFENIFKTHYETFCLRIYRITPDRSLTEDIVQEVFYSLWSRRNQLKIEGNLVPYLYTACINRALDHLRNQQKRTSREIIFQEDTPTENNPVEEEVQFRETQSRINRAVNALPPACRTVFILSRYENLRYKEIAEKLHISVNTVENQLSKALRLLRKQLLLFIF